MPANVATANLKPPMWSGLGAGRLIRDLGVGSEPAGFLWWGERGRERERGRETGEDARGTGREKRWGVVELEGKQQTVQDVVLPNKGESERFIFLFKSWINIIIFSTVHHRNKHVNRKSKAEQIQSLADFTELCERLPTRTAKQHRSTSPNQTKFSSDLHMILFHCESSATWREAPSHALSYTHVPHSCPFLIPRGSPPLSPLDLFNFRKWVNDPRETYFKEQNELILILEEGKVHVGAACLITHSPVWENCHISSAEWELQSVH